MVRIHVFFKKIIITIYLHPGAGVGREGRRRWTGLVLSTRKGWVGGGGGLGEWEGPKG